MSPSASDMMQFLGGQMFSPQAPRLPGVDLSRKTYIVTGANGGLGFKVAKNLASLNVSNLILACRDISKGEKAKKDILDTTKGFSKPTSIEVWPLDLDSHKSVLAFGDRLRTLKQLNGLLCNAGVELKEFGVSEGYERTLTVNVISTFLLAILALPKLIETANETNTTTNLTIVGSMTHVLAPHEQLLVPEHEGIFETLSDPKTADMAGRYYLSKLMDHLCTRELAQRLSTASDGRVRRVVINSVNPGWCKTDLFRSRPLGFGEGIGLFLIGRSSEVGSRPLLYAITAGKDTHGQYISECQVKTYSTWMRSPEGNRVQERLWRELSVKIEDLAPGALNVLR